MLATAIRNVGHTILFATVPVVYVLVFYRREARIVGDHERVPTRTWVALFATAIVWTLAWVGLSAWAYQTIGSYRGIS